MSDEVTGLGIGKPGNVPAKAGKIPPPKLAVFTNIQSDQDRVRVATFMMGVAGAALVDPKKCEALKTAVNEARELFGKNDQADKQALTKLEENNLVFKSKAEFDAFFGDKHFNNKFSIYGLYRYYLAAHAYYEQAKEGQHHGEKYKHRETIANALRKILPPKDVKNGAAPNSAQQVRSRLAEAQEKRDDVALINWMERDHQTAMGEKLSYTRGLIKDGKHAAQIILKQTTEAHTLSAAFMEVSQDDLERYVDQSLQEQITLADGEKAENPFAKLTFTKGDNNYRICLQKFKTKHENTAGFQFYKVKVDGKGNPLKNENGNDDITPLNGLDKIFAKMTHDDHKGQSLDSALREALLGIEGAVKKAKNKTEDTPEEKPDPADLAVGGTRTPAQELQDELVKKAKEEDTQSGIEVTADTESNRNKFRNN
jgi:hypothetical protein